MKKIKKILLLLLAFSFTILTFNSQAYAIEYYTFELTLTDVSDLNDIQYEPSTFFNQDLLDFLIEYGNEYPYSYEYIFNNDYTITYDTIQFRYFIYMPIGNDGNDLEFNNGVLSDDGSVDPILVGTYTFVSSVVITFTKTFWDQIIYVVGNIAVAFQAAATAGISLIYDGTALTSLGEIITITLGVGLVIGVFYLVIRVLPGARL